MPGQTFIPALKYDVLTPLYDVLIRFTLPERRIKCALVEAARIAPQHAILDLGCGTGTLLLLATRRHPTARFVGIDPDPHILEYARRKLKNAGAAVDLDVGSATALPYAEASFDRVLSSLVFHHLAREPKQVAFREVLRVLRPGAEFHLLDFGAPRNSLAAALSFITSAIGHEHVHENFAGMLPGMMSAAGFQNVQETGCFATVFGTIRLHRGVKVH